MHATAVAAMTVVLLGGTALSAAAQEDDFMYPLPYVEGVSLVAGVHQMGYMSSDRSQDEGTIAVEGFFTGGERTTDPRVTGRWHWDWTFEHAGDHVGTWWGPCGLNDAEGGRWEGTCTGVRYQSVGDAPLRWVFSGWYTGTREYAGLVYYSHVSGDHGTGTLTGVIYEGDPPPVLE